MEFSRLAIPEVVLLTPRIFGDERGYFMETFRQDVFEQHCGPFQFVQDNHSSSGRGILRGLHYQLKHSQGKLVRVTKGEVFDVAVDMRQSSTTFGQWVGVILNDVQKQQLWVPPGFAHGFVVISEIAEVQYKCTDYYAPQDEHSLLWNDPSIAIEWPIQNLVPILSGKDQQGKLFAECQPFA